MLIYTTGSDTYAVTSITDAGRAILDDVDASAQRTTLGLAIGSNVQAYDADLDDLADGTLSASKVENGSYFIGSAGTDGQVWKSDGDGAGMWEADIDTDTTYTAGTGLTLTGTEFSIDINGLTEIDSTVDTNDLLPIFVDSESAIKKISLSSLKDLIEEDNLIFGDGYRIDIDQIRARDSGGLALYDDDGTAGVFIEDGGNVGINKINPETTLHIGGNTYIEGSSIEGSAGGGLWVKGEIYVTNDTSHTTFRKIKKFSDSDSVKFSSSTYSSPSDERLKSDIQPLKFSLNKVQQLKGVTFDWNNEIKENVIQEYLSTIVNAPNGDKENYQNQLNEESRLLNEKLSQKQVGIIAQDLQKILPEAVYENENGYLEVNYSQIIPLLIEAIKEMEVNHSQDIAALSQQMNDSVTLLTQELNLMKQEMMALKEENKLPKSQKYQLEITDIGALNQEIIINYPDLVLKDTDGSLRIDVPKVLTILNEQNESHQKEATKSLID